MPDTFTVDVVTPERFLIDGEEAEEMVVPGEYGEIGVLPKHAPLLGSVKPGVLWYRTPGGKVEHVAVADGFLEISNDRVTVLVSAAERAADIDVALAKADAEAAAKKMLE
ncbi:MAG: ATP synthase F1 subunit epsilon, partial [Candidatus Methylomirabilis sp.]|nr:ATP synthase F1 subunit epsilon [Deltaproteobacteria bacterium]